MPVRLLAPAMALFLAVTLDPVRAEDERPGSTPFTWPIEGRQDDPPVCPSFPFDRESAERYQQQYAEWSGLPLEFVITGGIRLRLIPPGLFEMGSPPNEPGHGQRPYDETQHPVWLTEPFYLSTAETTVSQFRAFVESQRYVTDGEKNGGGHAHDARAVWKHRPGTNWKKPGYAGPFKLLADHPVVHVSHHDAGRFCAWLNRRHNPWIGSHRSPVGRPQFALPSEAQWEWACRAGSGDRFWWGPGDDRSGTVANVGDNSLKTVHPEWPRSTMPMTDGFAFPAPVRSFRANGFGLHDMIGNVWEFCSTRYGNYPKSLHIDPGDLDAKRGFVPRGGGWSNEAVDTRSATRNADPPHFCHSNLGFRVALQLPPGQFRIAEPAAVAEVRHRRVAERKEGVHIICHRGAVEFAHENTLEAYRAAFSLGADGNEIDIRATKDGVLVCFHDDMLDHLLKALGDVSDYTWEELQRFEFRRPGPFVDQCRIPTLVETLELHRRHAGLMHLDVKRPGLVKPISRLLDRMDMWNHVIQAPRDFQDARLRRSRYKASLYGDRREVDEPAIRQALNQPGNSLIVEDPRGVARALGRQIGAPPVAPVSPQPNDPRPEGPRSSDVDANRLLTIIRDADDWDKVAIGDDEAQQSAVRIERRARAAEELACVDSPSEEILVALESRVRNRSLHRHWRHHGLDGAAAFRTLVAFRSERCVELARFCLWRNDPAIKAVTNPEWKSPSSWTDWRTKTIVFPLLSQLPGPATEQLCRDYLALSDTRAREIGPPQFEAAARTLLSISSTESTAVELMQHRLSQVRGRAILDCLARSREP